VNSLVNQQQDTLRGIIEDFEEKVKRELQRILLNIFSKEKARLEEALSSESGQQLLAIRTFRVQLSKQTERINTLQMNLEQAQNKKEEKKNAALEVDNVFLFENNYFFRV
jgi:hypothetical protein